jgi:hypothetical protein
VTAEVQEILLVSKQSVQKFDLGIFSLHKLHNVKVTEHCQIEISDKFFYTENLDDNVDINSMWKNIRENIKV